MSNELESKPTPGQPVVYQIRIKGHLGSQWTDWFEGLTITLDKDGDTLLTGPIVDQSALHGLLKKVRDLGMPLISVVQVQLDETHPYRSNKEKKMNTNKSTIGIDPRVKLSLLWIFVVLLMVYADIVSLLDPTSPIREVMAGAPLPAGGLLAGAILMITSISPVMLSWVLSYKVNRWVTIIIGAYMIVHIVIGGHGLYYVLFATVEVACILLIIWYSWKWTTAEVKPE
ncbi:MAG: DUF6326 family protein [Anaerolineales bacterium]|nr:MAG: DUF6326 family protein [Anaerolineales bacterium]